MTPKLGSGSPGRVAQGRVQVDHHATHAAVADEQVAAQADEVQCLIRREAAHEYAQVVEVRRLVQPFRAAAGTPGDMARHVDVPLQIAAQRG